jgi:hypothetical protein
VATLHFGSGQSLVPSVAPGCREIRKGASLKSDLLQVIEERTQKLVAETGSDSAGEFETLAFVKAYKQFLMRLDSEYRREG